MPSIVSSFLFCSLFPAHTSVTLLHSVCPATKYYLVCCKKHSTQYPVLYFARSSTLLQYFHSNSFFKNKIHCFSKNLMWSDTRFHPKIFISVLLEVVHTSIFTSFIVSIQKIDEGAVHAVFSKALDNYIKWCNYLPLRPVWDKYVLFFLNILWSHLLNSLVCFLFIYTLVLST